MGCMCRFERWHWVVSDSLFVSGHHADGLDFGSGVSVADE